MRINRLNEALYLLLSNDGNTHSEPALSLPSFSWQLRTLHKHSPCNFFSSLQTSLPICPAHPQPRLFFYSDPQSFLLSDVWKSNSWQLQAKAAAWKKRRMNLKCFNFTRLKNNHLFCLVSGSCGWFAEDHELGLDEAARKFLLSKFCFRESSLEL